MPAEPLIDRKHLTLRQFAERFDYSMSTAARLTSHSRESYLRKAGERHKVILLLRQEGLSYRKIAAKAGVSVGTVHYALAKMNALDTSQFDSPVTP